MLSSYLYDRLIQINAWFYFFFFNDTATTEIYTLSLHDALPIFKDVVFNSEPFISEALFGELFDRLLDRQSTRLNSSHVRISYAVFCFKKNGAKGQPVCIYESGLPRRAGGGTAPGGGRSQERQDARSILPEPHSFPANVTRPQRSYEHGYRL